MRRNKFLRVGITTTLVSALISLISPTVALADSAPDAGIAFDVAAPESPSYGVQPPTDDPELQSHYVTAEDGIDLLVQTWLPEDLVSGEPVLNVPTVVTLTPYAMEGRTPDTAFDVVEDLVSRGYAFSVMHLRGTGGSGGCVDTLGERDASDGAAVIEFIADPDRARWSNGDVGLLGLSTPGGAALRVAGSRAQETADHLKAIVVGAPWQLYPQVYFDALTPVVNMTAWEYLFHHGIFPYCCAWQDLGAAGPEGFLEPRLQPGGNPRPEHLAQRPGMCVVDHLPSEANVDGGLTPHFAERDYRLWADEIIAPTFVYHGFGEQNTPPWIQAGLFDQIQAPKAGLFGWWDHELPDDHKYGIKPEWERADFRPMVVAWFDHYLKGIDRDVESWPTAQVQDNTGQWRAEPNWPTTGGPVGHLVLGDGGLLGDSSPSGSSSYTEEVGIAFDRDSDLDQKDSSTVFETEPFEDELRLTGQPLLDLYVKVDRPDAHIAVELEALDANGDPVFAPYMAGDGIVFGGRSIRHLDSLENNVFVQNEGKAVEAGEVYRVPVRLNVVDLVIPAGGRLRLRIAGSARWATGLEPSDMPTVFQHPTQPSQLGTTVTILHDCEYMSALRFVMPRKHPDLINVREEDEENVELGSTNRQFSPETDGGGVATAPVCGRGPDRVLDVMPTLGEETSYRWHPVPGNEGTPQ